MEYVLHMHNHSGWVTQVIKAKSVKHAIKKGLFLRAGFLEKEFKGKYLVSHDNIYSDYPRYRVIWNDEEPKPFPFGQQSLYKGDVWWVDRFEIGENDDCQSCGGTGENHYYPWKQCWQCGDQNLDGKGTGKNEK